MNLISYTLIFTFKSGAYKTFEDNNNCLTIQDNYRSDFLLTPRVFGLNDDVDYYALLRISTSAEANGEDYISFKNYCNELLTLMENNDEIVNIVLKDGDGNVYYNINSNDLIGIDAEGINNIDTSNKLSFRLYIYRKKEV